MKDRILKEALHLFSQKGYLATSMSDIASKLNVSKAALYKHYSSKQEIFDKIIERMDQMDEERMVSFHMPVGTFKKMAIEYNNAVIEKIISFSEVQFRHWTEEKFSSEFRKLLTLEQYRNEEMSVLYQKYLGEGPIIFMTNLFSEMIKESNMEDKNAKQMALDFYGPIYLLINMYDGVKDKEELILLLNEHVKHFAIKNGLTKEGE